MLNKHKLERWVLQNRLALDILTAAQGGACAIIHTQCCTYIPDMSTNVTHFTKHMNKMILAMDTPEASIASLSVQFSSVTQLCPTLCDPMNRSTPGLPVHHQLPEFTQTHVHRVSDDIQPSHPLLSPSPPAHNQSLFQ